MASRLPALLPRLVVLTVIWLLATSTITFAASARKPAKNRPAPARAPKAAQFLIVPDVRKQAYVFAKGMLDDAGFGWRVEGSVQGFAANTVAVQEPAPGVKVIDTGAPTVVLRLARNASYAERGLPENDSPQRGTRLVLAASAPQAAPGALPARKRPAREKLKEPVESAKESKAPKKREAPAEGAKQRARSSENRASQGAREPAFSVPGAPREPADEMPLPERARLLEKRLAAHAKPTDELVRYWLYQHSWIVTGARFGWRGGAEALRTVIRLDRALEARWGVGARSARVARTALAEVESKAGR